MKKNLIDSDLFDPCVRLMMDDGLGNNVGKIHIWVIGEYDVDLDDCPLAVADLSELIFENLFIDQMGTDKIPTDEQFSEMDLIATQLEEIAKKYRCLMAEKHELMKAEKAGLTKTS